VGKKKTSKALKRQFYTALFVAGRCLCSLKAFAIISLLSEVMFIENGMAEHQQVPLLFGLSIL